MAGTDTWLPASGDTPQPPRNPMVTHSYTRGVLDLHWDDPAQDPLNTSFTVLGCNIYRSSGSQQGPYHRLNVYPIGGTFYRDRTDHERVVEVVGWTQDWYVKGDGPNDFRYVLKTKNPIVKAEGPPGTFANSTSDVVLTIDGVTVPVDKVFGSIGEVTLINWEVYNPATGRKLPPVLPTADSQVTITYHRPANVVPTGPDTKVWYRISTVATATDTLSLLSETPLDFCEPRSHHEVENMDYIWREAVRRNNWILEQGGERVKLFVRKLSGQPCWCKIDPELREYTGQPSQRCHTCFPPGTLVRTSQGYRPIESVKVGDAVLSSDGTFQRVTKTLVSPFTGDLVSILPSVSAKAIWATPEHPIKVLKGHHQHQIQRRCGPKCAGYIEKGDGVAKTGSVRQLPSGKWWARVQFEGLRKILGTFPTEQAAHGAIASYLGQITPGHVLGWEDACNISAGDWTVAKWPATVSDVQEVHIPSEYLKTTPLGSERLGVNFFKVDTEFLWVVGLYLAEGCKGTRSIHFCLHRDETAFQNRVVRFFSGLGYNPTVRPHTDPTVQSAVVSIHSTTLSEWFPAWLGDGCQNKNIPEELMSLPPNKLRSLLQGVYDGDGIKRNNEITQTSEVLALQLMEILHRCGEQPLLRWQRSKALTPNGNERKLAFCVSWADSDHRTNRKWRWAVSDECLTQVRRVGSKPYSGLVYNLEVEGDHTYVVQGVVVHNCYGTGFVNGFEGPYEIIVGPDDGDKRRSQGSSGRRMESSYEVWMGPSPAVSQRDFIVKQTNERFSIGPVKRPSNRGTFMQQHFTIAYFDEGDIKYKVPITGTDSLPWPETRTTRDPNAAPYPVGTDYMAYPQGTEKPNIPDERIQRGRTPVWENISE